MLDAYQIAKDVFIVFFDEPGQHIELEISNCPSAEHALERVKSMFELD